MFVTIDWRCPLEKRYRIPPNGKEGSIALLPPPCGCIPKLKIELSSTTLSLMCPTCGKSFIVTIELQFPSGGLLRVRTVTESEPPLPFEGVGVTAPFDPSPPGQNGHAIGPESMPASPPP